MVEYNKLISDGYYYGHVSEIFPDISVFDNFVSEARRLSKTKDNAVYTNDIKGHKSSYYARYIPSHRVWVRRETIKKKQLSVSQQWWSYTLQRTIDPNVLEKFRNQMSNYMISIYGNVGLTRNNIAHGDNVALYEPGDFSEIHRDGQNIGRHAVIIIYLGENYNNDGGEFVFGERHDIVIEPKFGNFVMLDFTKNNVPHGVLPVKNNFKRLSYLDFVANLDMQ